MGALYSCFHVPSDPNNSSSKDCLCPKCWIRRFINKTFQQHQNPIAGSRGTNPVPSLVEQAASSNSHPSSPIQQSASPNSPPSSPIQQTDSSNSPLSPPVQQAVVSNILDDNVPKPSDDDNISNECREDTGIDEEPRNLEVLSNEVREEQEKENSSNVIVPIQFKQTDIQSNSNSTEGVPISEPDVDEGCLDENAKLSAEDLSLGVEKLLEYSCHSPDYDDEDVCPTCLEDYTTENPKIVMQCSHSYHLSCIYEWMERSLNCPVCGKVMLFDEST